MTIIETQKRILDKYEVPLKIQKGYFKFNTICWNIAKFMGMLFILNRIHDRLGFEGTVMLQLLIIIFMARSFFKQQKTDEQLKKIKIN